jgi:acetyl esterase
MALHPELKAILETPFAHMLFNLKENYVQIRAASESMKLPPEHLPPIASVENRKIPGPAGEIPVRIYTPAGKGPFSAIVFFHGGGFVLGDLDMHELTCRNLANASGHKIISVDYRLAPEHTFPAAPEDCYAATKWVAENAAQLQIDAKRISVAGDSAGGNLAAVVTLMARDRNGPALHKQVLVYPVTEHFAEGQATPHSSYVENAEGYMLTAQAMDHFWHLYLGTVSDADSAYASPLRAKDLSGLPAAIVITAEYDPLRDEGERYAARLREAGVPVTLRRFDGMIHGFWGLFDSVSKPATDLIVEFLKK